MKSRTCGFFSDDFFKEKVGAGPSHQNQAAPRFQNDVFVMQICLCLVCMNSDPSDFTELQLAAGSKVDSKGTKLIPSSF